MSSGHLPVSDFAIVGGGIIGLSVAWSIRRRWPHASVAVLEKEPRCGMHASGRNSGVLHSGFYYTADSLKARFTRTGNERMTRYCRERELPIDQCGKLVVARRPEELPWLEELLDRARTNGVQLHKIDRKEAAGLEPRARTVEYALFSPTTSVIDPARVVDSMVADLRDEGVAVFTSTRYLGHDADTVLTDRGRLAAGFVVNAAGLHADRVAQDYGFGEKFRVLPFKGLYLQQNQPGPSLRMHVYPVPDLRYPFLGVHFTRTVTGGVKIGPTALPALWREQYSGWTGVEPREMLEIGATEVRMLLTDASGFRRLAWRELRKCSRRALLRRATELVPDAGEASSWTWGIPGIRAQLIDVGRQTLVDDFVLEGDNKSLHVLNAVSPAFTCALPFGDFVVEEIDRRLATGRPTAALVSEPNRPTDSVDSETAKTPKETPV
jgi:L-2-hydroxyglutarate oxidase LhgO